MSDHRAAIVIGAGGHAKVTVSALLANSIRVAEIVDDDRSKWGRSLLGIPISGPVERVKQYRNRSGVLALGENDTRRKLARELPLGWLTVIHPRAYVHESVSLGSGTVVFAGAVIQPGAKIGSHTIINTSASVDHDCSIGDFVHIAPGAHLAGETRVDDGALIGIGSVVAPGLAIGSWATVGAGSVVLTDLPAEVTAFGAPARPS
jgi:sugar O-acyltransferase (sialic acid O-acetyltransferase NeuD family)